VLLESFQRLCLLLVQAAAQDFIQTLEVFRVLIVLQDFTLLLLKVHFVSCAVLDITLWEDRFPVHNALRILSMVEIVQAVFSVSRENILIRHRKPV
jgi:hypothetical protein